jgi:hypothetical protein
MINQHPITPPPELVQQWLLEAHHKEAPPGTCPNTRILIARAAQWAADQELKACVEWLANDDDRQALQAYRRPKPPSLKEQALELARPAGTEGAHVTFGPEELELIRRALEALPE